MKICGREIRWQWIGWVALALVTVTLISYRDYQTTGLPGNPSTMVVCEWTTHVKQECGEWGAAIVADELKPPVSAGSIEGIEIKRAAFGWVDHCAAEVTLTGGTTPVIEQPVPCWGSQPDAVSATGWSIAGIWPPSPRAMPFVIVSGVLILSQVIVRIWVKPTATAADQGQAFVFWIALLVGGLIATAILFLVGVAVPWGYLLLAVLVVFGMLLLVGDRMTTVERVVGKRSMAVGAAMGWLPIAMMIAFSGALAWLVGDL